MLFLIRKDLLYITFEWGYLGWIMIDLIQSTEFIDTDEVSIARILQMIKGLSIQFDIKNVSPIN